MREPNGGTLRGRRRARPALDMTAGDTHRIGRSLLLVMLGVGLVASALALSLLREPRKTEPEPRASLSDELPSLENRSDVPEVTASPPEPSLGSREVMASSVEGEDEEHELPPTPAAPSPNEGLLRVEVRSRDTGLPLGGIEVSLYCELWDERDAVVPLSTQSDPARGVEGDNVTTRADGTAELIVTSGRAYEVDAWSREDMAGEVELSTEPLLPGEDRRLRIELPTAYDLRFRGRVVDAVSGIGLGSASVRQMKRGGKRRDEGEEISTAEVAADGTFELTKPSWLQTCARIECAGYSPVSIVIQGGHELPGSERDIRLQRAGTLEVRFSGFEGRAAAVGRIRVNGYPRDSADVVDREYVDPACIAWEVTVDPSGRVTLGDLPVETELYLKAEVVEGERRIHSSVDKLSLATGEFRTLEIPLGSHAVVGRVVDGSGTGVANVKLWLFSGDYDGWYLSGETWTTVFATAMSDEIGRFAFDVLTPGVWSVGPAPGGAKKPRDDGIAAVLTRFTIPEAGDATLELRVHRDMYIRGRVIDVDGKVPLKCVVTCRPEGVNELHSTTDEEGRFRIGPLAPGKCSLDARPQREWEDWDWGPFRGPSESVGALAGDEEIVLRLRPAGVLSGRVERGPDEQQTGGSLYVIDGTGKQASNDGIEDDGTFRVSALEPGSYTLMAVLHDDLVATTTGIQVAPLKETSGIVLYPERGASIQIDFDPEPRAAFGGGPAMRWIEVSCNGLPALEVWLNGDGSFVVPAGDLEVRIHRFDSIAGTSGEVQVLEPFSLAAGEERALVVPP
jgi:hypothetical protein